MTYVYTNMNPVHTYTRTYVGTYTTSRGSLSCIITYVQNIYMYLLFLSHNELISLPAAISTLTNLQLLKLDHNKLKVLPVNLGLLTHLEELDSSHNLLSSLPSSLGDLNSLHVLAVTHNHLEGVPEKLGYLPGTTDIFIWCRFKNTQGN